MSSKVFFGTARQARLEAKETLPAKLDLILEQRQLSKLIGTYVDALPGLVNPRTGRLHTSFNQALAATGRLARRPDVLHPRQAVDVGLDAAHRVVRHRADGQRAAELLMAAIVAGLGPRACASTDLNGDGLPDLVIACVGGGSNAMGLFYPFVGDAGVELIGELAKAADEQIGRARRDADAA